MHLLIKELLERLYSFGIKEVNRGNNDEPKDWEKSIILKVIIAGAFYPNYFIYNKQNDIEKERTKYHILCGRDPCRTVYFTNFDTRHIGQLYTRSIKEMFKEVQISPENIHISFQSNSERVLVTFNKDHFENEDVINDSCGPGDNIRIKVPGAICTEVHKALRIRYLNISTSFNVME